VNSGTDINNRIIFSAAPGENPIIRGTGCYDCGYGLYLSNNRYIKIDGITFINLARWATLTNNSSYNEVSNSVFRSDTGEDVVFGFYIGDLCPGGVSYGCYSTHNWVHHNTLSTAHRDQHDPQSCFEGRDLFRIGGPPATGMGGNGSNNYNTVENNYMEYAGHTLFDNFGLYTVFKNNILHNDAWIQDYSNGTCTNPPMPNGKYGHRDMQISEDFGREGTYVLVENNRIGYSSANPNNPGEANFALAAPRNIVRYNFLYGGQQSGIYFKYASYGPVSAGGMGSTDNRVYNNTTYHNGWSYPYMQSSHPNCSTCPGKLAGITVYSATVKNVIKNNIAYDNFSYYLDGIYGGTYKGLDITIDSGKNPADYPTIMTVVNNWTTSNGDPKFVNPSLVDQSSRTLPDLSLQSNSPAIDTGTYLTTANGTGINSTNLIVSDALYFQDGSWGSDLARAAGNFQADWIAVGTINNVVQIAGINYSTNTITLKSPINWTNNAPVWLYKDSSGRQVLYGNAPDDGAYEYLSGQHTPPANPPPTPTNGSCSITQNTCQTGTFFDTGDSSTQYLWSCLGVNGGTTTSCSLAIPQSTTPPSPPPASSPASGSCGNSLNSCFSGTFSDLNDSSTQYLWQCVGFQGGLSVSCALNIPPPTLPTVFQGTGSLTITLNGSNPAYVRKGLAYVDPGASITGSRDFLFNIQASVNGKTPVSVNNISLNTSTTTTYTISYTLTDTSNQTVTATRTVIVNDTGFAPNSSSVVTNTTTTTSTTIAQTPPSSLNPSSITRAELIAKIRAQIIELQKQLIVLLQELVKIRMAELKR
jgi:hypothetical protein